MWLDTRKSVVSLSVNKNQDRIHTHYLSDVDSVDSGHAKTAACCFAEQLIFMLCPSPGSDAECRLHAMRVSCYRLQKIFPSWKADSPCLMSDTRMCVGPRQGVTKCPAVHLAGGWSRTMCHVMQSRFLVDFRMINRINRTIGCPAMKLCINIFLSLEYFVACNELNSFMSILSIIFYRHLPFVFRYFLEKLTSLIDD